MASIGQVVGTLKLRDEFTSTLNRATSQLAQSGKKMQRVGQQVSQAGASLTKAVSLPIALVGGASVKAFADFDQAMNQSIAIMGDVSDAMRNDMAKSAREVAKTLEPSAKEAAESYFFLASAGLDAAQSIEALPRVAKFAQAGQFDMALATDLLTDAQSALGLTIRDDVIKNMENMTRVSDVLVRANTLANATVQQFSTALTSQAAAAARAFNVPLEDTVATLAVYADQGVKAELAGNSFARTLRLLVPAARQNAEAYERLGVTVFDTVGNLLPMDQIVRSLTKALDGMSVSQKSAELEALGFQKRMQGVILPLLGTADALKGYRDELENAAGITDEVAQKQLQTFSKQLKLTKDRLLDVAITLGESLIPTLQDFLDDVVAPLTDKLAVLAEKFAALPAPIRSITITLAGVAAAVGPVLLVTGGLIAAWGTIASAAPAVASAISGVLAFLSGPAGWIAAGAALLVAWKPTRDLIFDLAKRVISSLVGAVKTVVVSIREWWQSTQDFRSALSAVTKIALRDFVDLIVTASQWVARIAVFVGKAVVKFLEWVGVIAAINVLFKATVTVVKTLVTWVGKLTMAIVKAVGGIGAVMRIAAQTVPGLKPALDLAIKKAMEWAEEATRTKVEVSDLEDVTGDLVDTTGILPPAFKDAADGAEGFGGKVELTKEQIESMIDALDEMLEPLSRLREDTQSSIDHLNALADIDLSNLDEELKIIEKSIELGLGPNLEKAAEKINLMAKEAGSSFRTTGEELAKMVGHLVRVEEAVENTRKAFEEYRDTVGEARPLPETLEGPNLGLPDLGGFAGTGMSEGEVKEEAERLRKHQVDKMKEAWDEIVNTVTKRAWENIQDIATDAIADIIKTGEVDFESLADSILDIFANMLAELLIKWAANAAKRILLEQSVAAAGSASGGGGGGLGGIGSMFGGGGGAGGGGSSMASAAIPYAAVGAIVLGIGYAMGWWGSKGPTVGGATVGSDPMSGELGVTGGFGENFGVIRKHLEEAIENISDFLNDVALEVVHFNDVLVTKVEDVYRVAGISMRGKTAAEIEEAIAVVSIRTAEFSDRVSDFLQAILAGSKAITEEQLRAEIELARTIESFGKTDIQIDTAAIGQQMDGLFDEVVRLLDDNLDQMRFGLMQVAQEEIRRWQETFREITGQQLSPAERLEILKANARVFNAEKALRISELKARQANLLAEKELIQTQLEMGQAGLRGRLKLINIELGISKAYLQASAEILAAGLEALNLQLEALDALIAGLEAIPDIDIDSLRLPDLGSAADQTASDLERLRDMLRESALQGMSPFEQALARINDRWDEAIRLAHGDAELLALISEAREREVAALREQRQMEFGRMFQDFVGPVEDGPSTPFGDALSSIRDEADSLRDELMQVAEDLGLSSAEVVESLLRIHFAEQELVRLAAQDAIANLAGGLAGLIDDEDLRQRLLLEQERIRFVLKMEQMRAEFELLKAQKQLTVEQVKLLQEAFDWIDANVDFSDITIPPVRNFRTATRDVSDAVDRMAERLASAKDRIRDFLLDLQTGAFGGRSSSEMFTAAMAQFRQVRQQVAGGNIQAIEQFPETARQLLEIARARFGSTARFQEILAEVEAAGIAALDVSRVTQDNVVFDDRFFANQQQQIAVSREGNEAVVGAIQQGFEAQTTNESRSREDILEELRALRAATDQLHDRLTAMESRRRTDKRGRDAA